VAHAHKGVVPRRRQSRDPTLVTVVDDDANALCIVERIIKRAFPNASTATFSNPADALRFLFATTEADVMVTNHGLGPINGLELIQALRGRGSEVAIIMMSEHPELEREALSAGANYFLEKRCLDQLPALIRSCRDAVPNG